MTGELLAGRYRLERELGRGGMATVFLAQDLTLARRVAVKVMHPGEDGRRAERFRREAELVASLKHPNVLEVHDFGEDAVRGPFLVCEWVQGESLRELSRRLSPVPPEVAALLGWELARALEAAHARGVVHRDVKPENVLVSEGGPLKLADFGIAALADQERLTSTGAITGSLPYMAPERIDTGAFSPASDVYAVGVILFELCTGTTPHAGQGSAQLAVSVMTRDAPPLAEAAPGTPGALATLVDRCLARDARDRPASGQELAAGLEAVVGQLVGPPAEASRSFFQAPEAYAARWRETRFQRLLSEGRLLLAEGEGARAARLLNEALAFRPGSPEVMALLRTRPGMKRRRGLAASAVAVGVVLCALGVWGWRVRSGATHTVLPPDAAASVAATDTGSGSVEARAEVPVAPDGMAAARDGIVASQAAVPVVPDGTAAVRGGSVAVQAPVLTPPADAASSPSGSAGGHSPAATPRPDGASTQRSAVAVQAPVPAPAPDGASARRNSVQALPSDKASALRAGAGPLASRSQSSRTREPVPPAAEPPEAEPPRTEPPAPAPTASAPTASAPTAPVPTAPAAEPHGYATLTVVTRPWAEVFVDGQSRGYTPRVRELRLPAGTHRLRFDNPLCDPVEEVIELSAGETLSRELNLKVLKAEVTLVAPSGARVFVDGVEVGIAPLRGPVRLTHGAHVVSAREADGTAVSDEINVVAGSRMEVMLGSNP